MSDHEFASNPKPVENTILSHALLYFRTAPRYFLTREGRGLHFFRAIVSERSETQNQALLLPVKSISVSLMKFKKPSNINAFCPSITTARLLMRRAKLYQLMLMMWRRGWDSNPRGLASKLISSQPRYDRFDTSAHAFWRLIILLNEAESVNLNSRGPRRGPQIITLVCAC